MTRRELLALLGAAAGAQTTAPGRTYTVDAVVVLIVIPIWKRSGVGRGRLSIGSRNGVFNAEFSGGAIPERANGIRNAGLLSETVVEKNSAVVESRYFGMMTSFGHDSAESAKKVLEKRGALTCEYSVLEGVNTAQRARSAAAKFVAEQPVTPDRIADLAAKAREAISQAAVPRKDLPWSGPHASGTLLHSLWLFALYNGPNWYSEYIYAAHLFSLQADKKPDRSTGDDLSRAGLTRHPERIVRMRGRITRKENNDKTPFTLWYEEGSPPTLLRLEWQPRAFLKLRFTADRV